MRKKLHGISRIDSRSTHGWYARIYANGGVFASKLFSDRQFGGKQKALDGAIKWRDHNQMVADLNKKKPSIAKRPPFFDKKPKNNVSGVVGVHKVHSFSKGKDIVYIQATWSEFGRTRSKKFYVSATRTEEEAFEQAIALRKQKEQELYEKWQQMIREEEKNNK